MTTEVEGALTLIRARRAELAGLRESAGADDVAEFEALTLVEVGLLTALAVRLGSLSYLNELWQNDGALLRRVV